jgi:Lrp/AsnC family leucine-responsive transcriptional regulator
VITGFGARVDHARLGRPLEASIDVWQTDKHDRQAFEQLVRNDDRVVECFFLTGPLDFRLRARLASAEDLNDLLITMKNEGGVRQTDSRLILQHLPTEPT